MAAWTFTLAPWAALVIGALIASYRTPTPAVSSAVQHLAAGVVFAAAATEVLPDVLHGSSIVAILLGGVVGLGFAAGMKQGLVLLIALTLEILFLGLTASEEMRHSFRKRWSLIVAVAVGGALLPIGALLGGPVHMLPPFWLEAAFSFAMIALLYLVTEELLVEAHNKPDSPLITSMFFVGFLGLLTLETAL